MSYLSVSKQGALAVLTLDQPREKVNVLTRKLLEEFPAILDDLETDDKIKSVVILSGKEDNFIAGADINMFQQIPTPEEMEELAREGSQIFSRIAGSRKPFIAAMHGSAMGGGLELALACHYRIGTSDPKTKFALPEVQLGLLPGLGGTQRLTRLIGISSALDMMLTGRNIFARQARKMGLVDELIHRHGLPDAAKNVARQLAAHGPPKRNRGGKTPEKMLEFTSPGRKVIYRQARKKVMSQTRGNMPAPFEILECVRIGMDKGLNTGLSEEQKRFAKLAFTPESQQLVHLYFAMQDARKNPAAKQATAVNNVGVIGAGLMGSGIADISAQRGYNVILKDRDYETATHGIKTVWNELQKKVGKKVISEFDRDQQISRLAPAEDYDYVKNCELVIEAVFEDLDLKRRILRDVESHTKSSCIFASNTSSLPIAEIAKQAERPEQVIGMHYFSPVQKMPLLEIITTDKTAEWVAATARQVGIKQGKHVIVVGDGPGFYTTRILVPYMNEALNLLKEGISIEQLDEFMLDFGFPVGPAALMDEVGLDVAAHVGDVMQPLFRKRGYTPDNMAKHLLEHGYKGRKNNQGFYDYSSSDKHSKTENDEIYQFFGGEERSEFDEQQVQQRMSLMMINEAAHCLQDGILATPQDGDLGAVLGLGFPPFRGGPFRFIDSQGAKTIANHLEHYKSTHGNRFSPAPLLQEYAKGDKMFYQ